MLSLGCGQERFETSRARRALGGLIAWRTLMFESMPIQSLNTVGQARLIAGGDRILRVESAQLSDPIELWNWRRAKDELPEQGSALADGLRGTPGQGVSRRARRDLCSDLHARSPASPDALGRRCPRRRMLTWRSDEVAGELESRR